jgi:hypothetical protein
MIPGIGEFFDLLNAGISWARGNKADALLSLASASPVGGQGATIYKWGNKASNLIGHTDEAFEIIDGVRRSKAADLAGNGTIPAKIYDLDGNLLGARNVSIDSLRSPKVNIDVGSQAAMDRWNKTWNLTKSGSPPPPIDITPGTRGTRIKQVGFDFGGQP